MVQRILAITRIYLELGAEIQRTQPAAPRAAKPQPARPQPPAPRRGETSASTSRPAHQAAH
ncbi:MAG: hypothetical protein AB9M60_00270 [Leptothrix sp. (in: b-proteobacteria)]